MNRNIFENAKFGDRFVTRDGQLAIYNGVWGMKLDDGNVGHILQLESSPAVFESYYADGKYRMSCYPDKDIIGLYEERPNISSVSDETIVCGMW